MADDTPAGTGLPAYSPWDPAGLWRSWWRTFGSRGPLSGDVTQAIDTSWFRSIGDQLGFININTAGAGDPALERRITEQVASYGRQLGRVLDTLDVLIRRVDPQQLTPEDRHALVQLQELRDEINAVKAKSAADRIDRLVAAIQTLRRDPKANRDALQRLREALAEEDRQT
jgi:hypothetical protein